MNLNLGLKLDEEIQKTSINRTARQTEVVRFAQSSNQQEICETFTNLQNCCFFDECSDIFGNEEEGAEGKANRDMAKGSSDKDYSKILDEEIRNYKYPSG